MVETATIYFPDEINGAMLGTYVREVHYLTDIEVAFSGREQRRRRYPPQGYTAIRLTTRPIPYGGELELMRSFLEAVRGRGKPFYYFEPVPDFRTAYLVGETDGTADFIFPFRDASSIANVLVDGNVETYSEPDFGPGSEFKIQFDVAPAADLPVTVDFEARRRFTMRLDADKESASWAFGGETDILYWQFDLAMREVR